MTPNYSAGDVILRPAIFYLLTDAQAVRKIGHAKVAQNPCTLILDVLTLRNCDAHPFYQHPPQRFSVGIQRENFWRARCEVHSGFVQSLLLCSSSWSRKNVKRD